jgi:hypothetical protein
MLGRNIACILSSRNRNMGMFRLTRFHTYHMLWHLGILMHMDLRRMGQHLERKYMFR